MNTRICPRYEGSVMDSVSCVAMIQREKVIPPRCAVHLQEVIDVEKTVSPKTLLGAPNERPLNDCPVLRWSTAGSDGAGVDFA